MLHLLFVTIFRICIVFLAFGFIGYALPFILCTMICCCLPCIISVLGVHEDLDLNRGATTDTINALVAYKFKSKRVHDGDVGEGCGGVLAAGTDKERTISAEDAVSSLMFLFTSVCLCCTLHIWFVVDTFALSGLCRSAASACQSSRTTKIYGNFPAHMSSTWSA
jgi:hypothetical protein